MTTEPHNPDDPFGYRQQFDDAISDADLGLSNTDGERASLRVFIALGRCRVFGVEPEPPDEALLTRLYPAAAKELGRLLPQWTQSAQTLDTRWYRENDPWGADDLISAMIELRTDLFGIELVLPRMDKDLKRLIDVFDAALASQSTTLSILVGSTWFENYRRSLGDEFLTAPPWWFGVALEEEARNLQRSAAQTMPSSESWRVVRTAHYWKSAFSKSVETGALAADVEKQIGPAKPRVMKWESPDGRYTAELSLPRQCSTAEEQLERPLEFWRSDGNYATELDREVVVLGGLSDTIAGGKVIVTLAQLRDNCDGRLFVGLERKEWPLQQGDEK